MDDTVVTLRAGVAQRRGLKPLRWRQLTALLAPPEACNPSGCRRTDHFRWRVGTPSTPDSVLVHVSSFKLGRVRAGPGDARLADVGAIGGETDSTRYGSPAANNRAK